MRILLFAALAVAVAACDSNAGERMPPASKVKLLPDRTPYIASVLDFSPDTTVVPTEVWVGFMTDKLRQPNGQAYDPFTDRDNLPMYQAIFGRSLNSMVFKMAYYAGLKPEPETGARVSITGPLGGGVERAVGLVHKAAGVYVEPAPTLTLTPHGRYRLDVTYPDGRRYEAETVIPEPATGTIPRVKEVPIYEGVYATTKTRYENNTRSGKQTLIDTFSVPATTRGILIHTNLPAEIQRDQYNLRPGETLDLEDRPGFLREGSLETYAPDPNRMFETLMFTWGADERNDRMYRSFCRYLRLTYINDDYFRHYVTDTYQYGASDDAIRAQNTARADAFGRRDTSFFYRTSNIRSHASNPGSRNRAAGVFAATASRYGRTAITLKRTWDPFAWNWREGIAPAWVCD